MKYSIIAASLLFSQFALAQTNVTLSNNDAFIHKTGTIKEIKDLSFNDNTIFLNNNNNIVDSSISFNINNEDSTVVIKKNVPLNKILLNYIHKKINFYDTHSKTIKNGLLLHVNNKSVLIKSGEIITVPIKKLILTNQILNDLDSRISVLSHEKLKNNDTVNYSYVQNNISWTPIYDINIINDQKLNLKLKAIIKNDSIHNINNIDNLILKTTNVNQISPRYENKMMANEFSIDNNSNNIDFSNFKNSSLFTLQDIDILRNSTAIKNIKSFNDLNYVTIDMLDFRQNEIYSPEVNSEVQLKTSIKIEKTKNPDFTKTMLPTANVTIYDTFNNNKFIYSNSRIKETLNNDVYISVPSNKNIFASLNTKMKKSFKNGDKIKTNFYSLTITNNGNSVENIYIPILKNTKILTKNKNLTSFYDKKTNKSFIIAKLNNNSSISIELSNIF